MDQTTISIISTVLGISSLYVVFTGYNVPEIRRNFFGRTQVFREKANIIESTMTAIFTTIAALSFLGLVMNDIYGDTIPERLHESAFYWGIFIATSFSASLIIKSLTFIGKETAKDQWMRIGIDAYSHVFSNLKNMDFSKSSDRANERLSIMEKYFELEPSETASLQERFEKIQELFKNTKR